MNKLLLTTLASSLLLISTSSHAFSWYPGASFFQDQDLERLINADGSGISTNSKLDVGDRLSGVLSFDTISNFDNTLSQNFAALGEDLTGIFDVVVTSKTGGPGAWVFEFGAYSGFESTYGAGAAVALFNQNPGDLDIQTCSSVADCESKATNGIPSPYLTLGFTGDTDEQWKSKSGTDDLAIVKAAAAGTRLGTFNIALGIITNNTGKTFLETAIDPIVCTLSDLDCAGDALVMAVGSGEIKGGSGLINGYDARSNFDLTMTTVPEPSTVALMGIALLGMASRLSRKSA